MLSIEQQQKQVTELLAQYLPAAEASPQYLHQAMHYACLNGGKRIRPLLVYATGDLFAAEAANLHGCACAVEMIHCYSLIHDDLPAMDDDNLRRGKPTCHKAFDEATAILAGDALQALAFEVLTHYRANITAEQRLTLIGELANACGAEGMAGGQSLDLQATGKTADLAYLQNMHQKKTGALISASICMGAIAAGCPPDTLATIRQFAQLLGLAFQVQDDILDVIGETEQLGKQQGADISQNKLTYPALLGLASAQKMLLELQQQASALLATIVGKRKNLAAVVHYITSRQY